MEWINYKTSNGAVLLITPIVPYHFSFVLHSLSFLLLLLYRTTFRLSSIVRPSYYYYCTVPLFVCPPWPVLLITTIVPYHFSFVLHGLSFLLLLLYRTTFRLSSLVCPSYYYYCTVSLFVCPP
jgi:uncharacterized membrane protein YqjE